MSRFWMRPAELDDVVSVATQMREWDRREIFACRWDEDAVAFAEATFALCHAQGACWVAGLNRPIAIIGGVEQWPGFWSAMAFATDEFAKAALGLTKAVKGEIIPWMLSAGARRVECRSHAGHTQAHRWLTALGAKYEARHPEAGCDGADFLTFAWRRVDVGGAPDDGKEEVQSRRSSEMDGQVHVGLTSPRFIHE